MKSPIPSFLSFFVLLFLTFYQVDLNANSECNSAIESAEYLALPDNPFLLTEDNPCYAPDWYYTTGITQYSATCQWEDVYGASYYSLQWRYPNGSWYNYPGYCYESWANLGNLQSCSSYEWRVRSHCGSGYYSPWCYPVYFNTLCDNCPQPYNTYASNITDHSATLHWSEVWGSSGYTVQILWPSGSWTTVQGSPCQENWLSVYYLEPGTMYEWRVRANCNYYNDSDWAYGWFTTTYSSYCHYPDWLQCYDITDYSATWKWANVYGAEYYNIQWRNPGGSWYDLSGGPHYGTWVNVHHLNACTTYEWRVQSYCHNGGWSNWCYPYTFTTTCHNCPAPTGLHTLDIGDYKATLKWSPVYGASSYTVQLKNAWGSWYDVAGSPTSGVWITVGNLSSCKSYEWRVRANCHYGSYSYWSTGPTFTTTCGNGCYAPQWVYTNGISSTSATLHWAPVSGADYYVVEWRPTGGTWIEMTGGPFTNTWIEVSGLQPGSTYEWRVKSHCYTGYFSGWSSQTYFSTLGVSCGMPFFRYTLPITDSTATFNWSAVAGALNYTVQIRLPNGTWQDVVGSPTTGTSITATGLVPNTQYEWRMQVNCSNGAFSPWLSSIMFSTGTSQGCNTPHTLYADGVTLNSATLNWAEVASVETYSVEIRALPNGSWNPVPGSPVDTNFITVNGLNPFTTYQWRVRANCTGDIHSFWSLSVQFTTTNAPPCNPPSGLTSNSITETTAILNWLSVSGALGYEVQTRLPNGNWFDLPGGGIGDTLVLATGFTPNTTYEWRVRTKCDTLYFSNWSAPGLFTTIGSGAGNDDCANAVLLTVENTCVSTFASNVDATPSDPLPVGGCWANGYKDVWFRFNMPDIQNPAVTIRTSAGSLGNAVMEVYSGSDCGILSLIACEDNNDNGNGSSMPVINLTGTPNATIWVRVWGYDGSTGTFTICVFDHISFNYAAVSETVDPETGEYIAELEEVIQLTTEEDAKPGLHVSPNPVSDILNILVQQTESSRVAGLRILNLSGKDVFTQKVEPASGDQFRTGVDVSNLVPGIYIVQVLTTNGMLTEKISVTR